MKELINTALDISRDDHKPTLFKLAKLQEEGGELAEAVLHHEGFLPHKTMKEPLVGEVADVILVALDILRACHPDMNNEELISLLSYQLELKSKKWRKILPERVVSND